MFHRYSIEEIDFLKNYTPGHSYNDITKKFNETFNLDLTLKQISSTLKRYGFCNGLDCQFKKGQTAYNKGSKMSRETYEKVKATMFKKGNKPAQTKPIGSERINRDNYIEIKLSESGRWKLKHIYIWEQVNGKLPENHCIIFLDSNIRNFDINNLKCVSRAENLFLNNNKLRFNDSELTNTAVNVARLNTKIREAKL
jgi:hypothetical protein